jgi:hypothetical protein
MPRAFCTKPVFKRCQKCQNQTQSKPNYLALQETKMFSMYDKINDIAARHFEPLAGEKSVLIRPADQAGSTFLPFTFFLFTYHLYNLRNLWFQNLKMAKQTQFENR